MKQVGQIVLTPFGFVLDNLEGGTDSETDGLWVFAW